MLTTENLKQMRERHKQEIQELQDGCHHNKISECMPFMWAPGHHSHCVRSCDFCGKILFTTHRGNSPFDEHGKEILLNKTPEGELFECPKRDDCHYVR